ncbi:MAG: hypothetical protein QOE41_4225 [Mycobacterium sp.]|nr:SAM-dependent methyltransferase [Mycobacterium sp.]MDT5134914.1 hypothetical protein [Mycobacterium sp.]
MNWDSAYREEGRVFEGAPPWNNGEPQPEIAELIRAGKLPQRCARRRLRSRRGVAAAGGAGYTLVGIDVTPTATEPGLSTDTHVQDDITPFTGYDRRFSAILDSILFHSLPLELRDDYLRSVHRFARRFLLSCWSWPRAPSPPDAATRPNKVSEDELREAVSNADST